MEWNLEYVISQVLTVLMYVFLGMTYYAKDRKKVLILSFLSLIANGLAYVFLSAWSGLAMCIVAFIRNIIFLIDEKKNGKRDQISKFDIGVLVVLYVISIISAVFTYEGFLSLLSVFATMLYTYSVWQKKTSIYKMLGIIVEAIWMIYNIYIFSILGIIVEILLLISAIIGIIREYKLKKENK